MFIHKDPVMNEAIRIQWKKFSDISIQLQIFIPGSLLFSFVFSSKIARYPKDTPENPIPILFHTSQSIHYFGTVILPDDHGREAQVMMNNFAMRRLQRL